jgi:hypothetical protein
VGSIKKLLQKNIFKKENKVVRGPFKFKSLIYFLIPIYALIFSLYSNRESWDHSSLEVISVFIFSFSIFLGGLLSFIDYFLEKFWRNLNGIFDLVLVLFLFFFTFIPVQGGLLDGQSTNASLGFESIFRLLGLSVFFICGAFFKLKKRKQYDRLINSICFSLIVLIVFLLSSLGFERERIDSKAQVLAEQSKLFSVSENNIFVLYVETIQGSMMHEMFLKRPDRFSELAGFHFYPFSYTAVPYSPFSVAATLHGEGSFMSLGPATEIKKSLKRSSILMELSKRSSVWEIFAQGSHFPDSLSNEEFLSHFGGARFSASGKNVALFKKLLGSSLRRFVPIAFWNEVNNFEKLFFSKLNLLEKSSDKYNAREAFVTWIKGLRRGDIQKKNFHYNFNYMSHVEVLFEEDGRVNFQLSHTYENQVNEFFYTLSLYSQFFRKLKTLGVYDSALIVLLSDHGSYFSKGGVYNNALFVKRPFAKGELRVSKEQVNNYDINKLLVDAVVGGSLPLGKSSTLPLSSFQHSPQGTPIFIKPVNKSLKKSGANYRKVMIKNGLKEIEKNL